MDTKKSWACRFGRHQWGAWRDFMFMITGRLAHGSVQQRCEKCDEKRWLNLFEQRKLRMEVPLGTTYQGRPCVTPWFPLPTKPWVGNKVKQLQAAE